MKKIWVINYSHKLIVSLIAVILLLHPLVLIEIQADDSESKSVLDSYKENNNAPSIEDHNSEEASTDGSVQNEANTEEGVKNANEILPDQSLFSMLFQLFLGLAVIIFMIYALIRFIGKRSQSYQSHRTLKSLGGVHVGTNRSVQLVKLGDRILVVGVGENIQLLKEIDNDEEVQTILQDYEMQDGQQQFSSAFKRMQSLISTRSSQEMRQSSSLFNKILERQLKDVKESQSKAHAAIKEKDK